MARRPSTHAWALVSLGAGAAAGTAARLYGVGHLRAQAVWLGVLAFLFIYGLRAVRLPRRGEQRMQREAAFNRLGKRVVLGVLAAWLVGGGIYAAVQAFAGYTELSPEAVLLAESPLPGGYYAATGTPLHSALYTMSGSEGDRFIAPLDAYEGRLLVISQERPPRNRVRVTGRIRTDLKTVQRSQSGQAEGPFLARYRSHMRLPPREPVYILDTADRAGLNVATLLLVAAPLYLILLLIGAPVRPD